MKYVLKQYVLPMLAGVAISTPINLLLLKDACSWPFKNTADCRAWREKRDKKKREDEEASKSPAPAGVGANAATPAAGASTPAKDGEL